MTVFDIQSRKSEEKKESYLLTGGSFYFIAEIDNKKGGIINIDRMYQKDIGRPWYLKRNRAKIRSLSGLNPLPNIQLRSDQPYPVRARA